MVGMVEGRGWGGIDSLDKGALKNKFFAHDMMASLFKKNGGQSPKKIAHFVHVFNQFSCMHFL